jgi:hypothetical protein
MCSSKIFWMIVGLVVGFQVMVISFGGRFFQVYSFYGLAPMQWFISVGIGAMTIPVSFGLRLLPFPSKEKKGYSRKSGVRFNKKTGHFEPAR